MIERVGKSAVIELDRHLTVRVSEDGAAFDTITPALAIDQERIARFCLSADTGLTQDLIMLCGAIWWADRRVTRKRATAWARRLELIVPVFEHKTLRAAAPLLARLLRYLTGDDWRISFRERTDTPMRVQGLPFQGASPAAVMPFSDGLDSFAQYHLLAAEHPGQEIWRVRTTTRNKKKSDERLMHVPLSVLGVDHPEASYRTRPFVFFLFAALAAHASGASRVVIAENGQGSLAPSLLPFANEWPFRSTHPVFVQKLAAWLDSVLPAPVSFEQPQLWRTKGEVLEVMAARGGASASVWVATQSCSNNHRHLFGEGGCGFCGGCVLRRASVHCAGIDSAGDRYAFDAASTAFTLNDRSGARAFSANEADIFRHSVRSMREFAEITEHSDALTRLQGECMDIDPAAPEEALRRLVRLSNAHKTEVRQFTDSLPESALLRQMAA
ncbi:MAG: hypothetical protein H7124_01210 [Phycisphaerales bacterium]|nr:hypothetical protein [Hyphomonadaceae bacterium]